MNRRLFLQSVSALLAQSSFGFALIGTGSRAEAQAGLPLQLLKEGLKEGDAVVLVPSDEKFAQYQIALNKRHLLVPQARILVRTADAIATAVKWARENGVPFAIRCGGHSYEGFSQSKSFVIDVRLMNEVEVSGSVARVGAGAALGRVYEKIAEHGKALPAGSCPTVGVSGHTLGGGFGLLARPLGLACDSVRSMELVDAEGRVLKVNDNENQDLFWALRGGGNGQFGIVSEFEFKLHDVKNVSVFGMSWALPVEKAVKMMRGWQDWVATAPDEITSIFKISKSPKGGVALRIAGQSTGSEKNILANLNKLSRVMPPVAAPRVKTLSFFEAVKYFGGSFDYPSVYMKAKSDYVSKPMGEDGMKLLMNQLLKYTPGAMVVICDSYGGAINRVAPDATAFAHREGNLFSIQYYSEWSKPEVTEARIAQQREVYALMRPHVSGGAYVNYCDLDLKDYQQAYWGANLSRLQDIKAKYDPKNLFRHVQSVAARG